MRLHAGAAAGVGTVFTQHPFARALNGEACDFVVEVDGFEVRRRLADRDSAPGVLVSMALILLLRFAVRPLVLVLAKRAGLKATVVIGTAVSALQYLCLAQVQGIDAGHGAQAVWLSFAVLSLVIVLRGVSVSPAMAVTAHALGALVGSLYVPTLMTAIYIQAKNSECALRFHLVTEAGWDAGCGGGCLLAAALIAAGVPLGGAVMISLGGSLAALLLLRKYYSEMAADVRSAPLVVP